MLNPKNLANGQEQYETFRSNITRKTTVQYDYRHTDGELFSCVKPTLEASRKKKTGSTDNPTTNGTARCHARKPATSTRRGWIINQEQANIP